MKQLILVLFCFTSLLVKSQQLAPLGLKEYTKLKESGKLNPKVKYLFKSAASPIAFKNNHSSPGEVLSGTCGPPPTVTYTTVIFDQFGTPDSVVDDASTSLINLPFNFCFYGTNYNSCYINSNGNITFVNSSTSFSSTGFPNSTDQMIAPFWADFDNTTVSGVGYNGLVKVSIGTDYMLVKWDSMGFFNSNGNLRNTCSVLITDGISTMLPSGFNIGFFYENMDWTTGDASGGTNGFGGTASTVGVNKGDGINFIQIGRFDTTGTQFISNTATNNGVDWLDYKSFYFNICTNTNNIAPICTNYSPCDTVKMCGLNDTLILSTVFASPEVNQTTTITVSAPTLGANFTTVSTAPGSSATIVNQVVSTAGLAGYHNITFTATDNGTPAASTTVVLTLFISNTPVVQPVLSASPTGICPGASTTLTLINCSDYSTHLWSNGTGGCSTLVNATGSQYVTVQDTNGCWQTSGINIHLQPQPLPVVVGNLSFCGNQSSTNLSLSPPTPSEPAYAGILWQPLNATGNNFPAPAGDYTVTVTGVNGCVNSASFSVTNLGPPAFIVHNDTCVSNSNSFPLDVNFSCASSSTACGLSPGLCSNTSLIQVGNGTTVNTSFSYPSPYANYYANQKEQYLILASELTAAGFSAGKINSLAFFVQTVNGLTAYPGYTVKIGCTALTTFAAAPTSFVSTGLNTVYGPSTYNVTAGWNTHNFTTPYQWDGTSNLVVEICNDWTAVSQFTQNCVSQATSTTHYSTLAYYSDTDPACPSIVPTGFNFYSYQVRPNMKFSFAPEVNPANFTYSWAPATGLSSTSIKNPTLTPQLGSTTYTVTVTTLNGQCSRTDSVTVASTNYNISLTAPPGTYCTNSSVVSLAPNSPTPLNGSWSIGLSGNGAAGLPGLSNGPANSGVGSFNPSLVPAGTYELVYTIGVSPCQKSDSVQVIVNQFTSSAFNSFGPLCADAPQVNLPPLAANGGGTWTIDGNPSTIFDPATVGSAAPHVVSYTTNAGSSCQSVSSINVLVNPLPVVNFISDITSGCMPVLPVSFTSNVTVPGGTYAWTFGDAGTAALSNPVHIYTQAGAYSVSVTYTSPAGCVDNAGISSMITVNTIPDPDFTFYPTNTTTLDPHVYFTNTTPNAPGLIWNWDIAGLDSASTLNTDYEFPASGQFFVTLTATDLAGCVNTVTHPVYIEPDHVLYIPNAFTPNGDGKNDLFLPKGDGVVNDDYRMSIYNRWGEKIFETDDITIGWNGARNNVGEREECQVYVYRIIFKDQLSKSYTRTGHVTLMR